MSFVRKRLVETLPDDENLRYALDEQFLNTYISTQIRVLRESPSRDMTQAELAAAAKTGQSKISAMEGDYNSWSLRTLRKLARAFGVRLFVTFESWGDLIPRMENFKRENLDVPNIEDDMVFNQPDYMALSTRNVIKVPRSPIKALLAQEPTSGAWLRMNMKNAMEDQGGATLSSKGDGSNLLSPGKNEPATQRR